MVYVRGMVAPYDELFRVFERVFAYFSDVIDTLKN